MDVAGVVASFLFHPEDVFIKVEIALGSRKINLRVHVA